MPYIKPPPRSPSSDVFLRLAATVWLNHLRCRVRRCRRDGRCLGRVAASGLFFCIRLMKPGDTTEMLDFVADTIELATPELFAAGLAMAKTDEEREMITFRRQVFLYYYSELAKAGLTEPLGPPFIEGRSGVTP
ncbi:hypothetical protein ADU59_20585 [Pararhizobium polonicum]|uniref:Uncharacterized protein n=1 Tax=Pararhizobium polonicum TaxID=1612624 RepID=A0A1C7NX99_9HYPH|nr:hypothetical protein [Pararhizobium polonicum]OBZ93639.1 hypothetical protein ADU59_20585 [Pararhizobium polonicum]